MDPKLIENTNGLQTKVYHRAETYSISRMYTPTLVLDEYRHEINDGLQNTARALLFNRRMIEALRYFARNALRVQ